MYNASLILEGGGMRGLYTAGVLDYFLEKNLEVSQVYGVSAGALNAGNYISKQPMRNYQLFTDYIGDKRWCGANYLMKTGYFFNQDFVYREVPYELNKFDFETFKNSKTKLTAVVSNIRTGKAEYLECADIHTDIIKVNASSALPLMSKPIVINGKKYLDGGLCDSIPIKKSIDDGNTKNIVVLTQHKGFVKQATSKMHLYRRVYAKYPNFLKALEFRHLMYNMQLKYLYNQEKNGKAFIIAPEEPVKLKRLEQDKDKLKALYNQGFLDARSRYNDLINYLEK